MNRYYRSRDGARHSVIDRDFKIPVCHCLYREQADLVATALNYLELQNVAAKHTAELLKSTSAVADSVISNSFLSKPASGVLIAKCEHGRPSSSSCEDCRFEPEEP